MDIFVEQLVKKKRETKDFVIIIAGIVGALLIIYILACLIGYFPLMSFLLLIIAAGLIYGLYLLITSVNMEYEYAFTNGDLDVDAIINLRKRKRLTALNAGEIEIMAKRTNSEYNRYMNNPSYKKIYACEDKKSDDLYFVVYNEGGSGKILLFSPNAEIKDGFRKFNPQKVFLD